MDYIFKKLLSGTATAAIAATLFFVTPEVKIKGSYLEVSGRLKGIFTEKVVRILKTATKINVTFHLSLILRRGEDVTVLKRRIIHNISYNPLKEEYIVKKGGKNWTLKDKKKAYQKFSFYKTRFRRPFENRGFTADLYIEAHISYNSKLKLGFSSAALWDHYIPSLSVKKINLGNDE